MMVASEGEGVGGAIGLGLCLDAHLIWCVCPCGHGARWVRCGRGQSGQLPLHADGQELLIFILSQFSHLNNGTGVVPTSQGYCAG